MGTGDRDGQQARRICPCRHPGAGDEAPGVVGVGVKDEPRRPARAGGRDGPRSPARPSPHSSRNSGPPGALPRRLRPAPGCGWPWPPGRLPDDPPHVAPSGGHLDDDVLWTLIHHVEPNRLRLGDDPGDDVADHPLGDIAPGHDPATVWMSPLATLKRDQAPDASSSLRTGSVGCAPLRSQSTALSASISISDGSWRVVSPDLLYVPAVLGVRPSATTTRYTGCFFLPIRMRRIFTAISYHRPIVASIGRSALATLAAEHPRRPGIPRPSATIFMSRWVSPNCRSSPLTSCDVVPDPEAMRRSCCR